MLNKYARILTKNPFFGSTERVSFYKIEVQSWGGSAFIKNKLNEF